jgi:hypothetical protein
MLKREIFNTFMTMVVEEADFHNTISRYVLNDAKRAKDNNNKVRYNFLLEKIENEQEITKKLLEILNMVESCKKYFVEK